MSRTKEITVYKYSELSDRAKEHAREQLQYSDPYSWGDEALDSLKALAGHFGGKLTDWNIDWSNSNRSNAEFSMPDDMTINQVSELLSQLGSYDKDTLKGHGDCKLTGVCFDENAIDGFRKAFLTPENAALVLQGHGDDEDYPVDLNKLMQEAFHSWIVCCESDYEYQQSEERFVEDCEANDWEFDENGDLA